MEPPTKRPRTGPSSLGQQPREVEDDELNFEPEEVSQMRDPGYQLEQSRAFAAFKLKSTFEHIFQKYERDFTGIGDEIDLRTGKIITNNGHLERMRNERDIGILDEEEEEEEGMLLEDAFTSDDEDEDVGSGEAVADGNENPDPSGDEEDEERVLHGRQDVGPSSKALMPKAGGELQRRPSLPQAALPGAPSLRSEQLSSNFAPQRPTTGHSTSSANIWGYEPESVDPTWRVPEINPPKPGGTFMSGLYKARYCFPVSQGSQSVWASRQDSGLEKSTPEPARIDMAQLARARKEAGRVARPTSKKLLQVLTTEDDNEDDILGVSAASPEPRNEKRDRKNAAKDQGSVPAVQELHKEPAPAVEDEQTQAKLAVADPAAKKADGRKKAKTSAKKNPRPRKQLVPTRVQKTKQASQTAEISVGPIEEQPVGATTQFDSAQSLTSFVTDKEARERPKQQIVIELFSKAPSAEEITEVEDPEDEEVFCSTEQDITLVPQLAGLTVSEKPPKSPVCQGAPNVGIPNVPASIESSTEKAPELPKEMFTRHEIDPAYAFSDDEDGIPTTQARSVRREKQPVAFSEATGTTNPVSMPAMEHLENVPVSEVLEEQQEAEAQSNAIAEAKDLSPFINEHTAEEPLCMDNDDSEERDAEHSENVERRPSPQNHEAPEAPINTPSKPVLQPTEELPGEPQPAEQHVIEAPDLANTNNIRSPSEAAIMRELQLSDEQAQEAEIQGKAREGIEKEVQSDKAQEEELRPHQVQQETFEDPGEETEEEQAAKDTQHEEEKKELEPFAIPLGLDEVDDTSATEAEYEPEPEAMDIELPILPPLAEAPPPTGTLLAPPRRARPSSVPHSGRIEKSATSPMRHLNLQSSSPLKRYANPGPSSAKARRSVRFRASASPGHNSTSRNRQSTTGQRPAFVSDDSRSGMIDISDSSTVGPPSPASKPPRRKRQPKQPSTPSSRQAPITAKGSSSRKSIISLLSDDEDELTLDLFKTWTTSSGGPLRDRKRASYTPVFLAGPETKVTTPMKQRNSAAVGSGDGTDPGTGTGTGSASGKKRKAAWAFATPSKPHFGSPSGSLVRTPGGNMRRCGEDGFRCDRDFCFTCL